MPSRTPGDDPDTAADILGRWQAHHHGGSDSSADPPLPQEAPGDPAVPARHEGTGREVVEALGASPAHRGRLRAPAAGRSLDVVFPPRVRLRRLLGVLLLALLVATVGAGYLAYRDPTTLTLGAAGTLLVVTLTIYAVRAGSSPAHLAIRGGQLEVVRGQHREVFDLTSRFTRMEVVGKPGRRGWKVLMARFGRDPLVIDSSMVDPAAFTAALEQHRPGST